jgi:predicted aldo/keto reductase-like oxidoreductase
MEESRVRRWQVRRAYGKLAVSKEELDGENPNGNGSMCVDCGECLEKCPQEIQIPVELKKAHAILGKRDRISNHYSYAAEAPH